MPCERDHRFAACWNHLENSERSEDGYQKCVACAFEQGYIDGIANRESNFNSIMSNLPDRNIEPHKNARQAYERGYALGNSMKKGILP